MLLSEFPTLFWVAISFLFFGILVLLSPPNNCDYNNLDLNNIKSYVVIPITTILIPLVLRPWINAKNREFEEKINEAKDNAQLTVVNTVNLEIRKLKEDLNKLGFNTTELSHIEHRLTITTNNINELKEKINTAIKASQWIEKEKFRKQLAFGASTYANRSSILDKKEEKSLLNDIYLCIIWLFWTLNNYPMQEDIKPELSWYKIERFEIYKSAIDYIIKNIPKGYSVLEEELIKEQICKLINELENISK